MLGLRIKKRREELKLTQQELALKLGYKSRSSINKIEIGENDIPFSKLSKIANALDTSVSELMGWDDRNVDENQLYEAESYFIKKLGFRSDDDLMEQLSNKEKVDLYNTLKATGPHTKEELNKRFGTFNVEDYDKTLSNDSVLYKHFSLIMELVEMGVLDDLDNLQPDDKEMVYNLIKRLEEKSKDDIGV